jgi:hypothetical protein
MQARGRALSKLADLVEQHIEELAQLDGADAGKLLLLGKIIDIPHAVQMLRYYAGAADKIHGETLRVSGKYQGHTLKEPSALSASSSRGTSPASCSSSRSARRSPPDAPSSSSPQSRRRSRHSSTLTSQRRPVFRTE